MTDASPGPAGHDTPPAAVPSPDPRPRIRDRVRQVAGSLVLAAMTAMVPLAFAPALPASAAVTQPGVENPAARAAVLDLVGDHPESVTLPADFAAGAGYRPVVENGIMLDPVGDCSSPIQLPGEFTEACKAHDLGYDILRYAEQRGQPLHPWARQAIDATLQRRMHAACDVRPDTAARARCDVLATVATTGVDLNSRRQNYATPDPEYLFGAELSGERLSDQLLHFGGPAALGLVLASIVGVVTWRRLRPLPAVAAGAVG
ncbi:hypothetical protein NONO_c22150 [Nocardia nova SH22a]|uniref:Prokaryotic phospholipase A2 n=1 Tax=Nocardia nova SH22a TaxID=1415166 RepID=W5TDF9_9NOCA|nr:hypothetical protein [Nocardia nova]AHH17013.1 hypothetical protein NONO_c22150 [Nocardia nova SH22a]